MDRFFYLKDAAKGSKAKEFARKSFPITTIKGLEFCKAYALSDLVRRVFPFFLSYLIQQVANYRFP